MPSAYTPSQQIGASDPPLPDGPPSNAPIFRELLNNRLYLRGSSWGQLSWNGRLRVTGSSNTVFSVTVGPIDAVMLIDAASIARAYFTADETALDLTHVEGAPANLANDTFYYVYAWSDSAAPNAVKFQISSSPPTESGSPTVLRQWKRGQTANYRYLGWFRTDASGVPLAMQVDRGSYLYELPDVLATITASGLQSLATRIPPHITRAKLRASATRTTTTGQLFASVREASGSGTGHYAWLVNAYSVADLTSFAATFEILTNASQEVYVQSGGADSSALITVLGCQE
ncbi:MAG: hypothetical protein R3A48_12875 [Polyangiales bacterium]